MYCAVLVFIVCCAVPCCAVLCCAVLCYAVLCCAVPCRAVLCCAVQCNSAVFADFWYNTRQHGINLGGNIFVGFDVPVRTNREKKTALFTLENCVGRTLLNVVMYAVNTLQALPVSWVVGMASALYCSVVCSVQNILVITVVFADQERSHHVQQAHRGTYIQDFFRRHVLQEKRALSRVWGRVFHIIT